MFERENIEMDIIDTLIHKLFISVNIAWDICPTAKEQLQGFEYVNSFFVFCAVRCYRILDEFFVVELECFSL